MLQLAIERCDPEKTESYMNPPERENVLSCHESTMAYQQNTESSIGEQLTSV